MSSAIIIAGIAAVMLFVADPHYKRYILIVLAVVGLAALAVLVIYNAAKGGASPTGGFRGTRILAWLNPEACSDNRLPDTAGIICDRFRRIVGQRARTEYAEAWLSA